LSSNPAESEHNQQKRGSVREFFRRGQTIEAGKPAIDTPQKQKTIEEAVEDFRIHRLEKVKEYDDTNGDFDTMFRKARTSFHIIRYMSIVTFGLGVVSIILALIFGYTSRYDSQDNLQDSLLTIVFGGMGITSFVVHFIFAPATRIQIAMSNLLQAEIASVNYLNQMAFWLEFLTSPELDKRKYASEQLRDITTETLGMLEKYLEKDTYSKQEGKAKDETTTATAQ
jgi:hypothetical protein